MIKKKYIMNPKTMALIPAREIECETIAIETDNKRIKVKKSPFQVMQESCLYYLSSYEGRRETILYHTPYQRKVPIPVSIPHQMIFFPTHSPYHMDNAWISLQHIYDFHDRPDSKQYQSMITFFCNTKLPLTISRYTLRKQVERSNMCFRLLSEQRERLRFNE